MVLNTSDIVRSEFNFERFLNKVWALLFIPFPLYFNPAIFKDFVFADDVLKCVADGVVREVARCHHRPRHLLPRLRLLRSLRRPRRALPPQRGEGALLGRHRAAAQRQRRQKRPGKAKIFICL